MHGFPFPLTGSRRLVKMIPLLLSTYEYTAQLKGINRANQFRPWASSRAGMKRAAILEYGVADGMAVIRDEVYGPKLTHLHCHFVKHRAITLTHNYLCQGYIFAFVGSFVSRITKKTCRQSLTNF